MMSQPNYNHAISSLNPNFVCPFDQCQERFDIDDVKKVISPSALEKLLTHLEELPLRCGMPIVCQRCGETSHLDLGDRLKQDQDVECPGCSAMICRHCAVAKPRPSRGSATPTSPTRVVGVAKTYTINSGCLCDSDEYVPSRWFRGHLRDTEQNVVYTCQTRDLTEDMVRSTVRYIATAPTPFCCSCNHCNMMLERSEACTELKHCGTSLCSICGIKSMPGDTSVSPSHWKYCFRYEEDLLDVYYGSDAQSKEEVVRAIRRAMHLIRFMYELPLRLYPAAKQAFDGAAENDIIGNSGAVDGYHELQLGIVLVINGLRDLDCCHSISGVCAEGMALLFTKPHVLFQYVYEDAIRMSHDVDSGDSGDSGDAGDDSDGASEHDSDFRSTASVSSGERELASLVPGAPTQPPTPPAIGMIWNVSTNEVSTPNTFVAQRQAAAPAASSRASPTPPRQTARAMLYSDSGENTEDTVLSPSPPPPPPIRRSTRRRVRRRLF